MEHQPDPQTAAQIAYLTSELDRLSGIVENTDTPAGLSQVPSLAFDSVSHFANEFLEYHYEKPARSKGDVRWYPCWGRHPGVVWVMEVLWGSFEEARIGDINDGGGSHSAAWAVNTLFPLMDWITATDGPFSLCGPESCAGAGRLGHVTPAHQPSDIHGWAS